MELNVESIAIVCHEANKAYCKTIGDHSQPDWQHAPDWQRESAIKGVEFHLTALKSGIKPSPSASHDSWLKEKREAGWQYGPVKDAEKKEHPCFMPYDGLPIQQRLKDFIFSGDEANAEAEELWGVKQASKDARFVRVCDDCFQKMNPKDHPERCAVALTDLHPGRGNA